MPDKAIPDRTMTTIFVKLGGSLLTDKREKESPRYGVIQRLAQEVQRARAAQPDLRIVLGHGSGSFGHVHASTHGTRAGVATAAQWMGFAQTADAAARLNRIVVAELLAAGVPAWGIQPSVVLRCADGRVAAGPESTVSAALARGLLPVVYGDVALDSVRGGTIASTEEIFQALDEALLPTRIILAGEVGGVYSGDPLVDGAAILIPSITPKSFAQIRRGLGGSHGVDVTGGMAAKVEQTLGWIAKRPSLSVFICSGLEPENLYHALISAPQAVGSWLSVEES
jgi:isopentenyl phosphate kinase